MKVITLNLPDAYVNGLEKLVQMKFSRINLKEFGLPVQSFAKRKYKIRIKKFFYVCIKSR